MSREQWVDSTMEQVKNSIPEELHILIRGMLELAYTMGELESTEKFNDKFNKIINN